MDPIEFVASLCSFSLPDYASGSATSGRSGIGVTPSNPHPCTEVNKTLMTPALHPELLKHCCIPLMLPCLPFLLLSLLLVAPTHANPVVHPKDNSFLQNKPAMLRWASHHRNSNCDWVGMSRAPSIACRRVCSITRMQSHPESYGGSSTYPNPVRTPVSVVACPSRYGRLVVQEIVVLKVRGAHISQTSYAS